MALKVHLPLHGSQPCSGERSWLIQWSYEPCLTWQTQIDRSSGEVWHKTWSTGGRDNSPLQNSCHENPINSMKRQKDMTQRIRMPEESPWTKEPSMLQSMGSQRDGHNWVVFLAFTDWEEQGVYREGWEVTQNIMPQVTQFLQRVQWSQIGRASCRERV